MQNTNYNTKVVTAWNCGIAILFLLTAVVGAGIKVHEDPNTIKVSVFGYFPKGHWYDKEAILMSIPTSEEMRRLGQGDSQIVVASLDEAGNVVIEPLRNVSERMLENGQANIREMGRDVFGKKILPRFGDKLDGAIHTYWNRDKFATTAGTRLGAGGFVDLLYIQY